MRRLFVIAFAFAGCVKGNPEPDHTFLGNGGTIAITECGYSITTRDGAEAPQLGTVEVGPDPTPKEVHLGIVGDPRTSVVVQWRTVDETTYASPIRYGVGANLSADQLTQTATGI